MKKLTTYLMLPMLLFVCMSCSKDEPIETVNQDEFLKYKDITEFILNQNANSANDLKRGDNNGNGVFFVSAFSDAFPGTTWAFGIPGTNSVVYIDDPSDGRDRAIVMSDTEMMLNWNIQDPRLFVVDFNDGLVKYSNWCDENKKGLYQIRGKVGYTPYDLDGDGEYDIYAYNFNPANNDKNGVLHIKAEMNDSQVSDPFIYPQQGNCRTATEDVKMNYLSRSANGVLTTEVTFR